MERGCMVEGVSIERGCRYGGMSMERGCKKGWVGMERGCRYFFPIRTVKFNKRKHKRTKWITSGIIKSINNRDNLYRKLKETSPDSPLYYQY